MANNGKPFEHLLESIWRSYAVHGVAKIEKTDPPHRHVGGNKIQFTANPWLDYAGSFQGRCCVIEAKSHRAQRLPWRRSGGITSPQADNLLCWADHDALTVVLWGREHGGILELLVVTPATLRKADAEKWKSIHFSECTPAPSSGLNLLEDIADLETSSSSTNSGSTDTFTLS